MTGPRRTTLTYLNLPPIVGTLPPKCNSLACEWLNKSNNTLDINMGYNDIAEYNNLDECGKMLTASSTTKFWQMPVGITSNNKSNPKITKYY